MKYANTLLTSVILILASCNDPADDTTPSITPVLKVYDIIYAANLRDRLTIAYDSVASSIRSEYEFQAINATSHLTFDLDFTAPGNLRLGYHENTDYFDDPEASSNNSQTYDLDLQRDTGEISTISLSQDGETFYKHQISKLNETTWAFEKYIVTGMAHKIRYHEFKMSGGNVTSLETYVSIYNSEGQFEFVLQRKMEVIFDDKPNPFYQNIHAFYHDLITEFGDVDIIRLLSKNNISGISHDEFIRDWAASGEPEFWQHSDHIYSYSYANNGFPEKCWILIDSEKAVEDFLYSEEYSYQ